MQTGRRRLAEKQYKQEAQDELAHSKADMGTPAMPEPAEFTSPLALSIKGDVPGHMITTASISPDGLAIAPVPVQHGKYEDGMFNYRLMMKYQFIKSGFENFGHVVSEYVERNMAYRLPADHLLSLIYYNVFRAFVLNIQCLGLSFDGMCLDEYQSKFPTMSPDDPSLALLPPGLRPTELQRKIPHHPMWDIFPDPVLRDNALRYGEDNFDDVELCLQIFGDGSSVSDDDSHNRTGLIAWSDPASSSGWEVTEKFARNWSWFLKGAVELEASTNFWRTARLEEPIFFAFE